MDDQRHHRSDSRSAREESEEEDQESEEGERADSRDLGQSASRHSRNKEDNAIEVYDNSTEGESDNEQRSQGSELGQRSEDDQLSPSAEYDDRESDGENSPLIAHSERSEAESEDGGEVQPQLARLRESPRPSDYNITDQQETASGYESDGEDDVEGGDLRESYDEGEVEFTSARGHMQEMGEDELEDDEGDDLEVSGNIVQPEYWRSARTVQVAPEWETEASIDPALSGDGGIAETQEMVQVSSRGLAIESLVQMANAASAPGIQDDLVLDIDPYVVDRPVISVDQVGRDFTGEEAEMTLDRKIDDKSILHAEGQQLDLDAKENGEEPTCRSLSPEPAITPADYATRETTLAQSVNLSGSPLISPVPLMGSSLQQEEDEDMAEDVNRSPSPIAMTLETVADYPSQTPADGLQGNEDLAKADAQDAPLIQDEDEERYSDVQQSQDDDNRDVDIAAEVDVSVEGSVDISRVDQHAHSAESEGNSGELEDFERSPSRTVEPEISERHEEPSDIPLPEPEGYEVYVPDARPSPSTFDRQADFVRLTTPSNDDDDELEDGEIRDDFEAPAESSAEHREIENESSSRQQVDAIEEEGGPIIGVEVDLTLELEIDVGAAINRGE